MQLDSLRTLYVHELHALHDAEHQLLKVLPRMAAASSSEDLRMDFERQLSQSQEHVRRLEHALSSMNESPGRVPCKAMRGLLDAAGEMINAVGDPVFKDAGLISVAQRIKHCGMAGYGCARTYAEMLGENDAAEWLQRTLDEERSTDEVLTELAERLMHSEFAHA